MGWLGWTEQQTLDATIPAIELAFEGRVEMLKTYFGGGDNTPPTSPPSPAPMPANRVFAAFRAAAAPKGAGGIR